MGSLPAGICEPDLKSKSECAVDWTELRLFGRGRDVRRGVEVGRTSWSPTRQVRKEAAATILRRVVPASTSVGPAQRVLARLWEGLKLSDLRLPSRPSLHRAHGRFRRPVRPRRAAAGPREDEVAAYLVLARKYRPQTFAELIGQDAVVRTLSNAIARDRLAHAFLLTGVRRRGQDVHRAPVGQVAQLHRAGRSRRPDHRRVRRVCPLRRDRGRPRHRCCRDGRRQPHRRRRRA